MLKHRPPAQQAGLSLVEFLVAIGVSMLVLLLAMQMYTDMLTGNRRTLQESVLNSAIRDSMSLMTRDIKRAGYWATAEKSTSDPSSGRTATSNPYQAVTQSSSTILYSYAKDSDATLESNESFGFRVSGGVLQYQTSSGTWTDITPAGSIEVTGLTIASASSTTQAPWLCSRLCTGASCPSVTSRAYTITLAMRLRSDTAISRSAQTTVRVRSDLPNGACS